MFRNSEHYADPTAGAALNSIIKGERKIYRPLVYICSPFAGDVESNISVARKFCRYAVDHNAIPVAPHLLFPQFLNDNDPRERESGLFFGKVIMDKCQEIWVLNNRISSGMFAEITRAEKKDIKYDTLQKTMTK